MTILSCPDCGAKFALVAESVVAERDALLVLVDTLEEELGSDDDANSWFSLKRRVAELEVAIRAVLDLRSSETDAPLILNLQARKLLRDAAGTEEQQP